MTNYSNPRLSAVVKDWPNGGKRTIARFEVETHPTRGQRVVRATTHPKTGQFCSPKKRTYADQVRIVDSNDGRILTCVN
jgi:hypothetical protein